MIVRPPRPPSTTHTDQNLTSLPFADEREARPVRRLRRLEPDDLERHDDQGRARVRDHQGRRVRGRQRDLAARRRRRRRVRRPRRQARRVHARARRQRVPRRPAVPLESAVLGLRARQGECDRDSRGREGEQRRRRQGQPEGGYERLGTGWWGLVGRTRGGCC